MSVPTEEEKEWIRKAREKALSLLSYSDRTEKLLRDRLKEGGFPPFAVEEAVAFAKRYEYLNDGRFAENYVRMHASSKSARELEASLRMKGVSAPCIEAALEKIPVPEEEVIRNLCQKKYGGKDRKDPKTRAKAFAHFRNKGFSFDAIKSVLDHYFLETEDEDYPS